MLSGIWSIVTRGGALLGVLVTKLCLVTSISEALLREWQVDPVMSNGDGFELLLNSDLKSQSVPGWHATKRELRG